MERINKYFKQLFDDKIDIHQQFFNVILLVGIFGIFSELILSFIFKSGALSSVLIFADMLLFIGAFFLSNYMNKLKIAELLIVIMLNNVILPFAFIVSGGFKSGMPLWMVLGLIHTLFLLKGRKRIVVFIINCLGCFGTVITTLINPNLLFPVLYPQFSSIKIILSMFIVVVILGELGNYNVPKDFL